MTARRSTPPTKFLSTFLAPPVREQVDRASRIKAMLARWKTEDVSNEPEWDIDEIERLNFGDRS